MAASRDNTDRPALQHPPDSADNSTDMFGIRMTLPLILMLAQSVGRGESEPALWRFIQPNPKALIGIDWGHVRQSQAGAVFHEKMIHDKLLPRNAMGGFPVQELLDSIDRFLISSPGKSLSEDGADAAGDSGDATMLIAMQGHFDSARVRQMFQQSGAKMQAYETFQVYRPQAKQRDMAYVLFDAETILYGDAPSVFAALDRNRFTQASPQSPPAAGSLAARAAALEAKYEIWAIVDANEVMSNDPIADLFGANEWAASAQGFEAGLNLRTGLDADFFVHFSSDGTAKRVTEDLTRAVALAAKDRSINTQAQNIARKLKFNVDGTSAKISLRLNEQELEKAAEAFAGGLKAGERLAATAAATANPGAPSPKTAQAPAPSKPAVIRIEGLDDGPREIPYQDPEH